MADTFTPVAVKTRTAGDVSVKIDQTTPGTTNGVQINAALPAGTNAIGKLAANSGVDIGDVDVISCALPTGAATAARQDTEITALQLIDDPVGTPGSAVPSKGFAVGGSDGTNLRLITVDAAGHVQVDVLSNVAQAAAGDVAHDAADSGNPIKIGGYAKATAPTAVADGDRVNGWFTTSGALNIADGGGTITVDNGGTFPVQATCASNSGVDIGDVTVNNASGAAAVNVQDGGNSLTVDGTVAVSSIAAGDNNIGNVDVVTLPALVAGSAIIGNVRIDQTTPGTTNRVDIGAALPAGANAIGKLAANSGVDIGDVDVTSCALPTGAATSAKQDTEITALGTLNTSVGAQTTLLDDAINAPAAAVGLKAFEVAGSDGTYTRRIATDAAGHVQVDVLSTVAQAASGDVAHDAADSGNPVKIGGYAKAAAPTAVADGDRVNAWFTPTGALNVADGGGTVSIDDGGGSVTVDGTVAATQSGAWNVTNLANSGVDIGDVTINNASGASAVNIQDGGNSLTVDGSVTLAAAIPAGTNNIGDVDVLTVPAPLNLTGNGASASALRVTMANDSTGIVSLAAGTNAIGKLAANSGVDIGDVDVISCALPTGAATAARQDTEITSLQLIDDGIATVASASPSKGMAACGHDGTNARILKTDASGELQVDVLSVPAPVGSAAGYLTASNGSYHTSASLAAGASVDLSTADLGASGLAVLMGVMVSSSVPLKIELKYGATTGLTTAFVAFTSSAGLVFNWQMMMPSQAFISCVPGAGTTDVFRVSLTNMDNINPADVYATFWWDKY